jgi:hypothetical protein
MRDKTREEPHVHVRPHWGIARCGKIHPSHSGAESCTGIDVVAGFGAVILLRQGPHTRHVDASESITGLQR